MTIASVLATPLSSANVQSMNSLTATARLQAVMAKEAALAAAAQNTAQAVNIGNSTADISPLGQLLSVADTFPTVAQNAQGAQDEQGVTSTAARTQGVDLTQTATGTNKANTSEVKVTAVIASTQRFVETLNQVELDLSNGFSGFFGLQNLLGPTAPATAAEVIQLQANLMLANNNGLSTALSAIGINFQTGSYEAGTLGQASVDVATLTAALQAHPRETAELISQAVQRTSQLAADLVSGASNPLANSATDSNAALLTNTSPVSALITVGQSNTTTALQSALLDAALSGALTPSLVENTDPNLKTEKAKAMLQTLNSSATGNALNTSTASSLDGLSAPVTTPPVILNNTPSAINSAISALPNTAVSTGLSTTAATTETATPSTAGETVTANAIAQASDPSTAAAVASVYLNSAIANHINSGAFTPAPWMNREVPPISRIPAVLRVASI